MRAALHRDGAKPAMRAALGLGALVIAAAPLAGVLGCGSTVIDDDSHKGDGGGGAGGSGDTAGTGGGTATATKLMCPPGAWGRGLTDAYMYEYGEGIAVDGYCNIVVSGSFGGEMDIGGVVLSGQDEDVFVAKLDPFGNALWGLRLGTEPFQGSAMTAVDPAGDVVVAGTFDGTIDVAGTTLVAKQEGMFVIAFDANGEPLWGREFGDTFDTVLTGVAYDLDGTVLITGYGSGSLLDFGQGPVGTPGTSIVFVTKLDGNGKTLWTTTFDGSGARSASAQPTGNGDIWVAGRFQVELQVGPYSLASDADDGTTPFYARLLADGTVASADIVAGAGSREITGVAVTPDGGALFTGGFDNHMDFGEGPVIVNGTYDGFLFSVDSKGKTRWGVTFGGPSGDWPAAVAAAPDGGAWITGGFSKSIDFGGTHLDSAGATDAFVAHVDAGGQFTSARSFGGPSGGGDNGMAIAVDPDGSALVTGTYMGKADLGSGPVTSAGGFDVFVAKVVE